VTYFTESDSAFLYKNALNPEDHARLPFYSALAYKLSDSEIACNSLSQVRGTQRNPMLIFAILHFHALTGHSILAELYEKLSSHEPNDWASKVVDVLETEPQLIESELHRSTQTNEPNRTAALAAILDVFLKLGINDIHLIDVGCSMGFNLYPDFADVVVDKEMTNPGQLVTFARSGQTLGFDTPSIHRRIGIDSNPLDPNNKDDVLWIKACLWPEQVERTRRCEELISRMQNWPTSERQKGDANDLISSIVNGLDKSAVPVIFHSWVLAYFGLEEQKLWREQMNALVKNGAAWISFESPYATPGLSLPDPSEKDPNFQDVQLVVALPGEAPKHWGWSHPHARWIELVNQL